MSIIARNSITVSIERDIQAVYRFYKLQASTASVPAKPTQNAVPPTGWSKTEPSYTEGSTNSLYTVDLTVFTDSTFSYSDVSLSTSYEAAKAAYNKAVTASNTANQAQTTAGMKNAVFYQGSAPSTTGRKQYDVWFDTSDDNKMYFWDGSAWTQKQFGTGAIANSAITTDLLAASSVTADKIVGRSITAAKIATGTITANEIAANTITAAEIASHTITAGEITTDNIVGSNGWINLAQGTFNYGNKLIWNGTQLSVNGRIDAASGSIAGFNIGSDAITTTGLTIHKGIPAETQTYDPVTGEMEIEINYDQEPGYIVMEGYSNAYDVIISQVYRFTYNGFGITAEVNNAKTLQIAREEIDLFGVSQTQRQKVAILEKDRETEAAWRFKDYGKLSLYSFVWDGQEDPAPTDDPVHSIILDALDGSITTTGDISALGDIITAGDILPSVSNSSYLGASTGRWMNVFTKQADLEGNLTMHMNGNAAPYIAFAGTNATVAMIRFIDNTADGYGNGIAIGGGGPTIIGGGEAAGTILADTVNWPTASGQEQLILANDGDISFLSNVQNGTASARKFTMSGGGSFYVNNGGIYVGANKTQGYTQPGVCLHPDGYIMVTNSTSVGSRGGIYFAYNNAASTTSYIRETASGTLDVHGYVQTDNNISAQGAGERWIRAWNSSTGCMAYLDSGSGTDHGLYSNGFHNGSSFQANPLWIIRRTSDNTVLVPAMYNAAVSGNPVISNRGSGRRVGCLSCNSSTQFVVYGQWARTDYHDMYLTVSSSDPRLKENIKPATVNALDLVNRLPLYEFDWKTDKKHWKAGFIAPEVYEIEPELAIRPEDEEEGYWGINDFYLIGILTKAVQELSQKIRTLENRISA